MGHMKWRWFRRGRPLYHLDVFDEASRGGPWGAVDLRAKVRWTSAAAVGAVFFLLALPMNPFAQQLLAYPLRHTFEDSQDASLAFATAIDPRHPKFEFLIQQSINRAI